uniref:Uncharacterized protein n=1 Tax=Ditylenchus dipsaci TaxID=166011 RepID=A0A915EEE7_9BILA
MSSGSNLPLKYYFSATQLPGCVEYLNSSEEMFLDFWVALTIDLDSLRSTLNLLKTANEASFKQASICLVTRQAQLHAFLHVLEQAKMARWAGLSN